MSEESSVSRRKFLGAAGTAAAASAFMITSPKIALGTEANSALQFGLLGCGSRGPWIANFFQQETNSKCVAVHDYFRDRTDGAGARLKVPESGRFVGLDGYKELLEQELDAVAVISPAYFHPTQAIAALEAGKHVYLAKPIAVDAPGCQDIVDAANKHGGKLSILADFQTRKNAPHQAVVEAVHAGAIGEPVCGQGWFHASRLGLRTKAGTDVAKLRNWFFDIALSGDIIVEQSIHAIDVANWMLKDHPVSAQGMGGRKARTDVGDCWDHFLVNYTYPNEVQIDYGATQFLTGWSDICCRLFGTEGTADTHYFGECSLKAKSKNIQPAKTGNIYGEGAIENIKDFHASIMSGDYLNNTQESADSTMAAILGRMAAYEGRTVTWDEMVKRGERLDPQLDLPANGPELKPEPV
ncbi:MAG: Gfo/Idh/MocA family oxidoreductase [Candidatus Hydrogenedentota bacterium]